MTQQYLRQCSLIVGTNSGPGIELGALRVVFEVRRGDRQTPNTCDVRVYNVKDSTANTLKQPEFTRLQLQVAYEGQALATIFQGSIKQYRKGREDQKNSYIAFSAADSDEAYNFAPAAFTMAAGTPPGNTVKGLIKVMVDALPKSSPTGGTGGQPVTSGYVPPFTTNKSVRGRVCYGTAKDELRDVTQSQDCKWSVQDGAVTVIPNTGYIPGEAILITPFTGLIGVPEQTQNGLQIRVLLNPNIKIGHTVKLNSDINQYRYGLDVTSRGWNQTLAKSTLKLDADGLYYVMRAEHTGDTRGTPWYTDLRCLSVNAEVPITNVEQAAILQPNNGAIPRY
jgi:hypothetical protein